MLSNYNLKRKWCSEKMDSMVVAQGQMKFLWLKHNHFMRQMVHSVLLSTGKHIVIHICKLCIKPVHVLVSVFSIERRLVVSILFVSES